MELADPRVLSQLAEAFKAKEASPRCEPCPRMTTHQASNKTVYRGCGKRRRCLCGSCASCKENARWERVFAEKFADPNYYSGLSIRYSSPLNTI
jgi:hypothetical protein